jgi:hypothetical protein
VPEERAASDDASAMSPAETEAAHEQHIRALLARLGRPHPSGGTVIERAALMAEGADFDAVVAWILGHGGAPEANATVAPRGGGLHGRRSDSAGRGGGSSTPRRFVLPPGALQT